MAKVSKSSAAVPASGVLRPNADHEYFFQEGCFILEMLNDPGLDAQLSVARARVSVGETTRWHRLLHTTERYLLLKGRGRVWLGAEEPQDVGPGDVVLIAPGVHQRIANTGQEELVFLAVCTPPFREENYRDDAPD